jgi:hypothetical protein
MNASALISTVLTLFVTATPVPQVPISAPTPQVLAVQAYSLTDRYKNTFVNDVFVDNILLTLSYMEGQTKVGEQVDWEKVRNRGTFSFVLQPGKTFAFHDLTEDEYTPSVVKTTNAHFSSTEGFKSDGWLVGDGVCHLASFMNVVARQAGLEVAAPTRHDFATIPEVSREFGTAIYYVPGDKNVSSKQNLYVKNTLDRPIAFVFVHSENQLKVAVEELN